jgi:hypothetical protein
MVDRRCGLADTLSTALYFSRGAPPSGVSGEIRQSQFERAGRLARTVDVRRAIPYTMPRAVYLNGGAAGGGCQPVHAALRP